MRDSKELYLKNYGYLVVDPDIRNQAGIKFFQSLGFEKSKMIKTGDAIRKDQEYQLMVKSKTKAKA